MKEVVKITLNRLANCVFKIKKGHEEFKDVAYAYASTLNEIFLACKKDSESYLKIKNLISNNDYETVLNLFDSIVK